MSPVILIVTASSGEKKFPEEFLKLAEIAVQ
jgi:hypothetical protein